MNRTNIRHRAVDLGKPLQIIRDINELYKKEDNLAITPNGENKYDGKSILEQEMKKIIDCFDKKKTIVIPGEKGEGNFTTHNLQYKQTEYIRPKNYIVYSEKNRLEPKGKDYEISMSDLNFLKFEHFFISELELEKIISALENDINKGEMIPNDRVKEIISSIIPDKKQHVDKILRYWHTRREDYKKSLLRKFWKDQKYTDKYLSTTFRRREREKMKTRRNKKNDIEAANKMKEIKESTEKYLMNMVLMMKEREITKKNILILQQLEFEAEINMFRIEKINIDEKYKEFLKFIPKPVKHFPYSPIKIDKKDKQIDSSNGILADVINHNNIAGEKTDSSFHVGNETKKHPRRIKPRTQADKTFNPLSSQTTTPPIKPEQKNFEKIKSQNELILKHRIRLNRCNSLVIDRYIQIPNSFSPFDDDFNKLISQHKIYSEDFLQNKKTKQDFNEIYQDFLKGKFDGIIPTDSEEEVSNFNSQIRNFSSSYKQFLKQKRTHSEISI